QANALRATGASGTAVWANATFGGDQECYATLTSIPSNPSEIDLILKVQGVSPTAGCVEAWYDKPGQRVVISTFDSGASWRQWGVIPDVTFATGDQFGVRAYANGTVEVYQNHVKLGQASVVGWPFYANGGRVGVTLEGATGAALDDVGGGTWSPAGAGPLVTVSSPNG